MEKAEWQKGRYNNGNMTWSTPKDKDFINSSTRWEVTVTNFVR
jgi:hypothetical protein